MYTTLDFLVRLNVGRFIVVASPELKCRTTNEADIAHVVASYDSSQAVIYLFTRLPSNRRIPCIQCERATLPILNCMPQTFSLLPVFRPVLSKDAGKAKIVWHLSMLLKILLIKIFVLEFIFPKFFFAGFTLDASPFTETKRTLCIYVMKNMISKRSKLDCSLV